MHNCAGMYVCVSLALLLEGAGHETVCAKYTYPRVATCTLRVDSYQVSTFAADDHFQQQCLVVSFQ